MLVDAGFTTHDRGEAEDLVRRVYPGSTLRDCDSPFTFRQRVVGDDASVSVARFEVSSRSELAVEFDGVVGIATASGGDYRAATNDDPVDAAKPFLIRPGTARSWSTHHDLTVVNLDLAALTRSAGAGGGSAGDGARLRMASTAPLTDAAGNYWRHVARHAGSVFSAPALSGYELVRRATIDLVLASAVDAFGLTVETVRSPAGDVVLPGAVRRAVQFIDDHAAEPIGVAELAEASRMSVRGLQLAFRRALDTTPTDYLRRARLSHARTQLTCATLDETTVTDVALEWGFTNTSRFSRAYREAYGESPRQTLER